MTRFVVFTVALAWFGGCSVRRAPDAFGNAPEESPDAAVSRPEISANGVPMGYIRPDGSSPFDMTDLHRGADAPAATAPDAPETRAKPSEPALAAPTANADNDDEERTRIKARRAEASENADANKKKRRDDPSTEGSDAKRRR